MQRGPQSVQSVPSGQSAHLDPTPSSQMPSERNTSSGAKRRLGSTQVSLQNSSAPISLARSDSHGTRTYVSLSAHSIGKPGGLGADGGDGAPLGTTGGSGGPAKMRGPQSSQSVPRTHRAYGDSLPPSSQWPSFECSQVLWQPTRQVELCRQSLRACTSASSSSGSGDGDGCAASSSSIISTVELVLGGGLGAGVTIKGPSILHVAHMAHVYCRHLSCA